ncbi:MAG: glycosyltransferase [Acidimicrobiia bacterium]
MRPLPIGYRYPSLGGNIARKYLFVINSFLAGGAERSLVELLPRLVEEGVTPIIASLHYREVGFEEEVRDAGYDVRLLSGSGRLGKARALRRLIKEESPDLVYTSLFDADLAGSLATIGIDVPLISNLANTAYDPARLADPHINKRRLKAVKWIDGFTDRHMTDHFHAVSQAVKDSTVQTLGVDPDRITVVKRGRDSDRLGRRTPERTTAARAMLGIPEAAEVVVTVGRQEYQKGHRYLIEAFAGVVASRPDARLLIAGREGHSTAALQSLINELDLGSVVTLLGHRSDVPEVLAASELFVFPSLYEGLGGALIEALALGLPVVATDLPALREVVHEGENAILVPPRDSDALGSAIITLLEEPGTQASFGERSRELFEEEFRIEDSTDRMIMMLTAVAARTKDEPISAPMDDNELTHILQNMHDRRGAVADGVNWTETGRWRSFKAEFVKVHSESADVAVKFGDGWSPEDAHFVADEEERIRRLFTALPAGPVDVPPALGWSEEPAAVALAFVEGDTLFDILSDPHHPHWNAGEATLVGLTLRCGQAIGAYHTAEPAIDDDTITQIARDDLLTATRRAGIARSTILEVEPRLQRARGYRFSPNDFIVEPDGRLVMLDPPHVRKYDYLQRDISAFTYELHRALIGDGPSTPGHDRAELLAILRRSFLDGYATTGPTSMTSQLDDWMIRFYELSRITGLAYARVRRRQLRPAVSPLRWAVNERRRLGVPPA